MITSKEGRGRMMNKKVMQVKITLGSSNKTKRRKERRERRVGINNNRKNRKLRKPRRT